MTEKKTAAKKPMGLADLLNTEFVGPFEMMATQANRKVFPEAVRLVPASEEIGDKIMEALGIESSIICFQVAAFNPPLFSKHKCYLRRRNGIVECVPAGWAVMKAPQWAPTPRITTFDLIFNPDGRGRFIAKHRLTGQTILPRKEWELPKPDADGKITIPAGQAEIRPTASRTFWIAGEPGTLALISEHMLEVYDANGDSDKPKADPFAYAEQFHLFDQWYTAFEVCGNPLAGLIIELDRKRGNAALEFNLKTVVTSIDEAAAEFEKWVSRELLPLLHPDFLENREISGVTRQKIMDIADVTRSESLRLITWYRGWANNLLSDLRRRLVSGAPIKLTIPEFIPENSKKGPRKPRRGRLIELKRADLEKMLFKPKGDKPKDKKPSKDNKDGAAPTTPPAHKPARQTTARTRKTVMTDHTSMPISDEEAAKLADLKKKLEDTDTPSVKAEKPAKTGPKKPSLNAPCRCGGSHRRNGFTGEKFETCPKSKPDKLD